MSGVFLTGATGFVGKAVLEGLALEPEQRPIRALARTRTNGDLVAALGAEPVMGDMLEPATLRTGMEGCDVVFHLAGLNAMCLRDPAPLFEVNVTGSRNVVEAAAAAGVRRLVYTSSAASLGEEKGSTGSERSAHRGWFLSNYERSKYEAERGVFEAGERLGVEVVTLNPSSVQGPGRTTGSARLLIDYLNGRLRAAVDTRFSILDIGDCAEGHLLAERHGSPGERYVLSGATLTVREALSLLADITGLHRRVMFIPGAAALALGTVAERLAQVRRADAPMCKEMVRTLLHGHAYDGSKAVAELGVQYTPVRQTLRRTVEWYVDLGFVRRPLPTYPPG